MPPRHAYWTIVIGQSPTAFRARERDELLPTFERLRAKQPDAVMKWFERGRLWESPDEARGGARSPSPGDRRGPDWRPGGVHRDPRDRFKKDKPRPKRPSDARDAAGDRPRDDRAGARKAWQPRPDPRGSAPRRDGDRPAWRPKPEGGWDERRRPQSTGKGSDRGWQPKPDAPRDKPWRQKPPGRPTDKPWRPKSESRTGGSAPSSSKGSQGATRDRPWRPKPQGGASGKPWAPKSSGKPGDRPWRPKAPGTFDDRQRPPRPPGTGGTRPWQPKSQGARGQWRPKPGDRSGPERERDSEDRPKPDPSSREERGRKGGTRLVKKVRR